MKNCSHKIIDSHLLCVKSFSVDFLNSLEGVFSHKDRLTKTKHDNTKRIFRKYFKGKVNVSHDRLFYFGERNVFSFPFFCHIRFQNVILILINKIHLKFKFLSSTGNSNNKQQFFPQLRSRTEIPPSLVQLLYHIYISIVISSTIVCILWNRNQMSLLHVILKPQNITRNIQPTYLTRSNFN